jgi:CubicO group peptidase (beta-lactamase class C family)
MELDTVVRLASATKIVTTVAVMQCVDQGLIGLDDDVEEQVEELRGIRIIKGWEGDEPVLEEKRGRITVR